MRSRLYNQALVAVLAAFVGVAAAGKVRETYLDLRRVTYEVSRQFSRSGYGTISTGEDISERLRRLEFARPARPRSCPRAS